MLNLNAPDKGNLKIWCFGSSTVMVFQTQVFNTSKENNSNYYKQYIFLYRVSQWKKIRRGEATKLR